MMGAASLIAHAQARARVQENGPIVEPWQEKSQ